MLRPIVAEVVAQEHAAAVVVAGDAPAATGPDTFLRALPSEVPGEDDLRRAREHLDALRAGGRFLPSAAPFLGVLVLDHQAGDHRGRTVAVIGDVEVAAYRDGRVLQHERVDEDRVDELARYLEVVGAASTPVCLTHRPHPVVTSVTDAVREGTPAVTLRTPDGTELSLYVVTDVATQRELVEALAAAGQLYLADGHHRAAAVARPRPDAAIEGEEARVLTAVVPTDHLRVEPFHRRIDGPRPVDAEAVLAMLRSLGYEPVELTGPVTPTGRGIAHVTAGARWWRIDLVVGRTGPPGGSDVEVDELDVAIVERALLPHLRALAGPAEVKVTAVPGPDGPATLVAEGSIGVAVHPPRMEEVLEAADAGRILPPKTTYLAPKLPSGLLVVPRVPGPPPPSADPARRSSDGR